MARKIMAQQEYGLEPVLMTETLADNEAQLQEIVKESPDLLPVDEFEMIGRSQLLSIAWLFPSSVSGWIGLLKLTLDIDLTSTELTPSVASALEDYLTKVAELHGVEHAKPDWLRGYHLDPDATVRSQTRLPTSWRNSFGVLAGEELNSVWT